MAKKRKYSRGAGKEVKNEMHRYKKGKAKSGKGGKGGKVKSRKQAIAMGFRKRARRVKKSPRRKNRRLVDLRAQPYVRLEVALPTKGPNGKQTRDHAQR